MSSTHFSLYAQIEDVIVERISDGSLPAGSVSPAINQSI